MASKLLFEDQGIKNTNITPSWVKYLWTSPINKMNVTVIEFSTLAMLKLSSAIIGSLLPAAQRNCDRNVLFHYPDCVLLNGYIEKSEQIVSTIVQKLCINALEH